MRANKAFRWLWRGAHGSQQTGAGSQHTGAGSQQGAGAGSQQGAASQPQPALWCLWKNLCNKPPRHLGAHGSQASQTGAGSQQTGAGSQHESQPRPQPPNKPACALAPLKERAKTAIKAEKMKRIGNSPEKMFSNWFALIFGDLTREWFSPQSDCVLASMPELAVSGRSRSTKRFNSTTIPSVRRPKVQFNRNP
jgi:hypothetical protein